MTIIIRIPWAPRLEALYRALDQLGLVVADSLVVGRDDEGTLEVWYLDHARMVLNA